MMSDDHNLVSVQDMPVRLRRHVEVLAGEIGERNIWLPAKLAESAKYIEKSLLDLGYSFSRQEYEVEGQKVHNIEVEILGTENPEEIIVVGAHYDSRCGMKDRRSTVRLPGMKGTPGANDNASGVAALLEMARIYASAAKPGRTVRFVAFVNEEHPFFQTPLMGSRVYARQCREKREHITGMISFDDLGYFTDVSGSQGYPFPLNLAYPSTGNFIAFLSNRHSKRFLRKSLEYFRRAVTLPSIGCSVPAVIPRIGWSDDWAFWQDGYEAFCVTDTAFLRYQQYHTTEDTPDKLDYEKVASVVAGINTTINCLLSE